MALQQNGRNAAQQFTLNETYTTDEYKAQIRTCLEGKHQDSLPFPHFVFTNFVSNSALIGNLRKELQNVKWARKCDDLYSLYQTADLEDVQAAHYPTLSFFRHFMITEVRQWLAAATGIQLSENELNITGSCYYIGDCLLPHNDRLQGDHEFKTRAFAFVLYLTDGWAETDGGALCFYETDKDKHHPNNVKKKIQPIGNSLSLFRVQHNSWHSVEEVRGKKERLSLNGWFHYAESAEIPTFGLKPALEERIAWIKPTTDITLAEMNAWLNADYVNRHDEIKRLYKLYSKVTIKQFLNAARYNEALAELEAAEFVHCGPLHKRNVWQLVESKLAEGSVLRSLLRLLRSDAITQFLTQFTTLRLYDRNNKKTTTSVAKEGHEEGPPPKKKTKKIDETASTSKEEGSETTKTSSNTEEQYKDVKFVSYIHRYGQGCYSMKDVRMAPDSNISEYGLDFMLFFGRRAEWPSYIEGYTLPWSSGNEERIIPTSNTAVIAFREPNVMTFTKYFNYRARDDYFFVLNCSFFDIYTDDAESDKNRMGDNEADGLHEEEEGMSDEGEDGNQ